MSRVFNETPRFNELVLCFLSFLLDTSDDEMIRRDLKIYI